MKNLGDLEFAEVPFDAAGATDPERLSAALDDRAMCVVVGYPNFFGVLEDLGALRAACSRAGAQLISVTTEALSRPALTVSTLRWAKDRA